jgi:hypothetical protein
MQVKERWEERYSSSEMIYLEVTDEGVRSYLNAHDETADHWTFAEVLDGAVDYLVRPVFGVATLAKLKAAVRAQIGTAAPES